MFREHTSLSIEPAPLRDRHRRSPRPRPVRSPAVQHVRLQPASRRSFARLLRVTEDGRTLLLSNYMSNTLALMDIARMRDVLAPKAEAAADQPPGR